ncbi:hypothetical protein HK100_008644, partial [Physocladia obscura]
MGSNAAYAASAEMLSLYGNVNQHRALNSGREDNSASPVPSIDSEALELAITSQNGNSSATHNSANQNSNNQNNITASLLSQSAPRANSGFPIPSAANYAHATSSVPSLSRSASNGNLLSRNNSNNNNHPTTTSITAANAAPSSRFGFLSGASTGNSARKRFSMFMPSSSSPQSDLHADPPEQELGQQQQQQLSQLHGSLSTPILNAPASAYSLSDDHSAISLPSSPPPAYEIPDAATFASAASSAATSSRFRPTLESVFGRLKTSNSKDALQPPSPQSAPVGKLQSDYPILREAFPEWNVPEFSSVLGGTGMGIVYGKDLRVRQLILNFSEDQPFQLTSELSPLIASLSFLTLMQLNHHRLYGSLPTHIGNLIYLKELSLAGNLLSGPIPDSIILLRGLEILDLHDNQFSAPLPLGFCSGLKNLSILRLNNNMLTGGIPENIGRMKGLQQLYLGHNRMDGFLPKGLGLLGKLELMQLQHNRFIGELPEEFGQLKALKF